MSFVWGVTVPEGEAAGEIESGANTTSPGQGQAAGGYKVKEVRMPGGLMLPPDIYFLLVAGGMLVGGLTVLKALRVG